MQKWLTSIAFVFLTGCMVGPTYHRPCMEIPNSYYFEEKDARGSIDVSWWEQFNDPVLVDLISESLANNNDVKIAAGNIEQALGVLIQVKSQLFPQIGYSFLGNRQRLSKTTAMPVPITVPNPQTLYEGVGTLSWEIDLWGRIRRLTESARAQFFATYEARREVILTLVASVANAYLTLLGLDQQLIIAKRTQQSYLDAVNYFELQFNHGQVSQMTVASAKTQYEIAASQIPAIELQIVQTQNALSILLGRNPGPVTRGKSILTIEMPLVPAGIPSMILEQRPDVLQAEQELAAANAQIGAAKALYFPAITLTGDYGGASEVLKNLFIGPSKVWSYTGTAIGPIFTFGAILGQVIQAEGETHSALFNYKQTVIQAFADVENALAAHQLLAVQLESQTRLVEAASDYTRLSKLQYDGGYSPYFVVIQAQQQLFPAELSWVQTRVQLFSSMVNIYQAMGGGWVLTAESMTY